MKIETISFPEPGACCVTVREGAEIYEKAICEQFDRLRALYPVPGYAPGKAPRSAAEQQYGSETFRMEAMNHLLLYEFPALLADVCRERDIIPLCEPVPQLREESPDGFSVDCRFAVLDASCRLGVCIGRRFASPAQGGGTALNALLDAVLADSQIPIPQFAVQALAEERRERILEQLHGRDTTLDRFLAVVGKTQPQFDADLEAAARRDLGQKAMLFAVARQEKLGAGPQEVAAEIDRMIVFSDQNRYALSNRSAQFHIAQRLTLEKARCYLLKNNSFSEVGE